MIQEQLMSSIASPCINVCTLNAANGLCDGCFRTIDEISVWSRASETEKRNILSAVSHRREALSQ